jgi:hypothetical protein
VGIVASTITKLVISFIPVNPLGGFTGIFSIVGRVLGIAYEEFRTNPQKYVSLAISLIITNKLRKIGVDAWNGELYISLLNDAIFVLTGVPEYYSKDDPEANRLAAELDEYMKITRAIKEKSAADKEGAKAQALQAYKIHLAKLQTAPELRGASDAEKKAFHISTMFQKIVDAMDENKARMFTRDAAREASRLQAELRATAAFSRLMEADPVAAEQAFLQERAELRAGEEPLYGEGGAPLGGRRRSNRRSYRRRRAKTQKKRRSKKVSRR